LAEWDSYEANNRRDVINSALDLYHEIMQRPLPDSVPDADQRREIEQIVRAADAGILAEAQEREFKCDTTYRSTSVKKQLKKKVCTAKQSFVLGDTGSRKPCYG